MPKRKGGSSVEQEDSHIKKRKTAMLTEETAELPVEILLRCWRYMTDRKNVRLVCRRWNKIFEKDYPMCIGDALETILASSKGSEGQQPVVKLRQGTFNHSRYEFMTKKTANLIVELPHLEDLLNRIVFTTRTNYGGEMTTMSLVFNAGESAKDINKVLKAVAKCRLMPHLLNITGNLVGATLLMPTVKELHDNGNLKEIRFHNIHLEDKTSKNPVIDDRVLLPKIEELYIKPISGYFSISSAAFNAMITAENLAQIIFMERCKGINAEFVKSAVEAWKTAAHDRVKKIKNGKMGSWKDYPEWHLPITYEGDRTAAIKQLHGLMRKGNKKGEYRKLRSHKPTPEGRIYEDFEFDIGRNHLSVEAMFENPDGDKTTMSIGDDGEGEKNQPKKKITEAKPTKKPKVSYESDPEWEG